MHRFLWATGALFLLSLALAQPARAAGAPVAEAADATPGFAGAVVEIPDDVAAEMQGVSIHDGCPVPIAELRLVTVNHWNFAGEVVMGRIIVHEDVAVEVAELFRGLYNLRFPIERMKLIDAYGGSDAKSMEDNNTSSFNCRFVTGKKGVFSKHSYGRAIDINPRINPYVKGKHFEPTNAGAFLDRTQDVPGILRAGDEAVVSFEKAGWTWGGDWKSLKDYQHFEKPRRKTKR
jgi:D-alanyl-D-alanine dipeptidase